MDWIVKWFDNDALKVGLAGPAIYGTWCGPWSPSTTANLLLYEAFNHTPVKGGAHSVVKALTSACEKLGVEIRTNTPVKSLKIKSKFQ